MKFANYYYTFYYFKYSNDQANPTFVWSIRICHRCNKTPRLGVAYNSFISKTKRKLLKHVFIFQIFYYCLQFIYTEQMFWCKTLSRPESEVQFLTKHVHVQSSESKYNATNTFCVSTFLYFKTLLYHDRYKSRDHNLSYNSPIL